MPANIGLFTQLDASREYCVEGRWRSECDWDPTFSEFVARILLGRLRLGSNCRLDIMQESAALVRDITRSRGSPRK